jgi:hypothetical protein
MSDAAAATQIQSLLPSARPCAIVVISPEEVTRLLARDGATPPSVPPRSPAGMAHRLVLRKGHDPGRGPVREPGPVGSRSARREVASWNGGQRT